MRIACATWVAAATFALAASAFAQSGRIGGEAAVPRHLRDGEEFTRSLPDRIAYGERLFLANWTDQDGGGRPLGKGNGRPLSDPTRPLRGSRAFNRISGPDATRATAATMISTQSLAARET
jgi:hypothetical protein